MFHQLIKLIKESQSEMIKHHSKTDIYQEDLLKIIDYLNSIFNCINYSNDSFDYLSLSSEDMQFIYLLALNLSPDLFIGKIIFPNDQSNPSPQKLFYDIDKIPAQYSPITSSVFIQERPYRIEKILVFNSKWLNECYFNPMNRLTQFFNTSLQKSKRTCTMF